MRHRLPASQLAHRRRPRSGLELDVTEWDAVSADRDRDADHGAQAPPGSDIGAGPPADRALQMSDATGSSISSPGMSSSNWSRAPTGTSALRLLNARRRASTSSSVAITRASSASSGRCANIWTGIVVPGEALGGAKIVHWTSSTGASARIVSQPSSHFAITSPPSSATPMSAASRRLNHERARDGARADRRAGGTGDRRAAGGGAGDGYAGAGRGGWAASLITGGTTPARAASRSRRGSVAGSAAPASGLVDGRPAPEVRWLCREQHVSCVGNQQMRRSSALHRHGQARRARPGTSPRSPRGPVQPICI